MSILARGKQGHTSGASQVAASQSLLDEPVGELRLPDRCGVIDRVRLVRRYVRSLNDRYAAKVGEARLFLIGKRVELLQRAVTAALLAAANSSWARSTRPNHTNVSAN